MPQEEREEHMKNRPIVLSFFDDVLLFFSRLLGSAACCCCWNKRKKLEKMYEVVEERIIKELDVVKLLKSVKDSKLALKAAIMEPDFKFHIRNSGAHVLNLDKETSEDEDENAVDETKN